jgi:2-methylcitrate dehydratase PrpD
MKGVMAALIENGAAGPEGVLEYKSGFCSTFSSAPDPDAGIEALRERFEILGDIIKGYPTINCSQAPIQAMVDIAVRHDVSPRDIERIHLTRMLRPSSGEQGVNYSPGTVLAARLSIPYCLALAAHRRKVTLDDFTRENLQDSSINALMHKVEITVDEALNRKYPGGTAAMILRVQMKDGRRFEHFVRYPKGNPNNPMSVEEVQQKCFALVSRTLPAPRTRALIDTLSRLETLSDIAPLLDGTRISQEERIDRAATGPREART